MRDFIGTAFEAAILTAIAVIAGLALATTFLIGVVVVLRWPIVILAAVLIIVNAM